MVFVLIALLVDTRYQRQYMCLDVVCALMDFTQLNQELLCVLRVDTTLVRLIFLLFTSQFVYIERG